MSLFQDTLFESFYSESSTSINRGIALEFDISADKFASGRVIMISRFGKRVKRE